MCLCAHQEATEAYRKKNAKKTEVVVWKLLRKIGKVYETPFQKTNVTAGWLTSNRKGTKLRWGLSFNNNRYADVCIGIHCYTTRKEARFNNGGYAIVRCTALMEDFIGCDQHGHAAFRKIYVPKEGLK